MNGMPTAGELAALMRLTLNAPRDGAAEVLRRAPGRDASWLMFVLVIVLTVMAGEVASLLASGPTLSVLNLIALQAGAFLLMVVLLYHVGRFFGGTGSFDGALILVTWLQFIFIFVQIVQVVAFMILPFTAAIIAILSIGLFLWLLSHFAAELHGFTSMPRVVMGVVGTLLLIGVALTILAGMLGIEIQTGGAQ